MIPEPENVLALEFVLAGKTHRLDQASSRHLMEMLEDVSTDIRPEESLGRVSIHHKGANSTGGAEISGTVMADGSLLFGGVRLLPAEPLDGWIISLPEKDTELAASKAEHPWMPGLS